jgi:hypothetical protein
MGPILNDQLAGERSDRKEVKPANLGKLTRQAHPQKLSRDRRGRLVDEFGNRVHYVLHLDMSGGDPGPGKADIRVPGQTFKMRCGKEYMVMPSGAIRRLTPKHHE